MNLKRFLLLLTVLIVAGLLVTACSSGEAGDQAQAAGESEADHHEDDGDHHEDEADHQEEMADHHEDEAMDHEHVMELSKPIDGARQIEVIATEFGFEPSTLELEAGSPVNILLVNQGVVEHELQIPDFDFHVHTQPGESSLGGFIPDKTGEFAFRCLIPGHADAGMVGEVHVSGTASDQ